jgi:hypothetical protein
MDKIKSEEDNMQKMPANHSIGSFAGFEALPKSVRYIEVDITRKLSIEPSNGVV